MIEKEDILSRPRTIEQLSKLMNKFWNSDGIERGLTFDPRTDDIIISPYAKSGTTLLMQMSHALRTRGSMDFDEIMNVVPWIELAFDIGWDLQADQVAKPRLYKAHLDWNRVPKGGRYIVSFRHYHTNVISGYRFLEGWLFEPGTIGLEEFVKWSWPRDKMADQGYWHHLGSWWEQCNNADILLLCYEDMVADKPRTIRKVANFMGIDLDDELLDIVVQHTSREFMLEHREKFDQHQIVAYAERRTNIPPPMNADTVTPGTPDDNRYKLAERTKQELDSIWDEQITSKYGIEDYEDFRNRVRKLDQ